MPDHDSTAIDERRSSRRVRFFLLEEERGFKPFWAFDKAENSTASVLVDLSHDGCRLLINNDVSLSAQRILIEIHRPDEGIDVFQALVCWESCSHTLTHREIGCSFDPLDDGQLDTIEHLFEAARETPHIRCQITSLDNH